MEAQTFLNTISDGAALTSSSEIFPYKEMNFRTEAY